MKFFIYQGNDHDCGFASLKMFLANLAKDKSYLFIPKPKKKENYNLNDLARISKEYGVSLECYGCNKQCYEELDNPCLTLIDENHVVMVKKQNKRRIILYDPDRGIIKMKKDEFLRRWRCVILTTNYPDSVNKIKKIRHEIVPKNLKVLETFSSLFSVVVLIMTFYVLNKVENYAYSLIFLGLFVLFQLIEKIILYKQVYTFDKTFIPLYFQNKKNHAKEKYKQYEEYKRSIFTFNRSLLASVLTAFLITFLLCFNDFKNAFIILALILIKLLEKIILSKPEQDSKNVISEIENKISNETDNISDLALNANIKANAHILYSSLKDIMYVFISFIFALSMMFITNNTGCNYVIFHFMMYFAGLSSYNQIIDSLSLRKEMDKIVCRFFDSCNL